MCSQCCSQVYENAIAQRLSYDGCLFHKQPPMGIFEPGTNGPPTAALLSTQSLQSGLTPGRSGSLCTRMVEPFNVSGAPSQAIVQTAGSDMPIPSQAIFSQCPTAPEIHSQPASDPTPSLSQQSHTLSQSLRIGHSERKKTLSMPIAPEVLHQYHNARSKADEAKTVKQKTLELQETLKRTCEFVLYYQVHTFYFILHCASVLTTLAVEWKTASQSFTLCEELPPCNGRFS